MLKKYKQMAGGKKKTNRYGSSTTPAKSIGKSKGKPQEEQEEETSKIYERVHKLKSKVEDDSFLKN